MLDQHVNHRIFFFDLWIYNSAACEFRCVLRASSSACEFRCERVSLRAACESRCMLRESSACYGRVLCASFAACKFCCVRVPLLAACEFRCVLRARFVACCVRVSLRAACVLRACSIFTNSTVRLYYNYSLIFFCYAVSHFL